MDALRNPRLLPHAVPTLILLIPMSELHVRQIRANLEKVYRPFIDLSDLTAQQSEEIQNHFLTRGLSALSLCYIANRKAEDAARAVSDGYGDNGLDAVYYHPVDRVLYLVQSKWRHDGTGSLDRVEKFNDS